MLYTTHKNGDESGMVYGIAIPTLEEVHVLEINLTGSAHHLTWALERVIILYMKYHGNHTHTQHWRIR